MVMLRKAFHHDIFAPAGLASLKLEETQQNDIYYKVLVPPSIYAYWQDLHACKQMLHTRVN